MEMDPRCVARKGSTSKLATFRQSGDCELGYPAYDRTFRAIDAHRPAAKLALGLKLGRRQGGRNQPCLFPTMRRDGRMRAGWCRGAADIA
jgi:hypothetical protein